MASDSQRAGMDARRSLRRMELVRAFIKFAIAPMLVAAATLAQAAQLSTDARSAIPHDVQQLVVIDYRAMQNST
jgi:hypothetical protein